MVFLDPLGGWSVSYGNLSSQPTYVDLDAALFLNPNVLGSSYWLAVVLALAFQRGLSPDDCNHIACVGLSQVQGEYEDPRDDTEWWRVTWAAADTAEEVYEHQFQSLEGDASKEFKELERIALLDWFLAVKEQVPWCGLPIR